ncbi:hypothetical protein IL54_4829 [Sphingobium sp. ba1]|nr:hypothetical protein IL54_4829 [Sphingobium sp. ba1]
MRVDMAGGIDAEAIDAETVDPVAEYLDHPRNDARIFGHEVVQPDKVAHRRAFAAIGRFAPVVIEGDVVQPGGRLGLFLALGDIGRIGVGRIGQPGEIVRAMVIIAGEAGIDRLAGDAAAPLIGIVRARAVGAGGNGAFAILDDVGGVVGNDVHIDFHAPPMGGLHQCREIGVGAEMRIDMGEVGDPIAVIARTFLALGALHRLVAEDGADPDGGRAQSLDIV